MPSISSQLASISTRLTTPDKTQRIFRSRRRLSRLTGAFILETKPGLRHVTARSAPSSSCENSVSSINYNIFVIAINYVRMLRSVERESARWTVEASSSSSRWIPRTHPILVSKSNHLCTRILTRPQTHWQFIEHGKQRVPRANRLAFLATAAAARALRLKDILIACNDNERTRLSCRPVPCRRIAQCSLSSAWELTIICPTFLAGRVGPISRRDYIGALSSRWISWHNVGDRVIWTFTSKARSQAKVWMKIAFASLSHSSEDQVRRMCNGTVACNALHVLTSPLHRGPRPRLYDYIQSVLSAFYNLNRCPAD